MLSLKNFSVHSLGFLLKVVGFFFFGSLFCIGLIFLCLLCIHGLT